MSPSKRPAMSASSISTLPLNRPDSAISMLRPSRSLASTVPSTTSTSQAVISPDSEISRPTISFRISLVPDDRDEPVVGAEPDMGADRLSLSGRRTGAPGISTTRRGISGLKVVLDAGGLVGDISGPLSANGERGGSEATASGAAGSTGNAPSGFSGPAGGDLRRNIVDGPQKAG